MNTSRLRRVPLSVKHELTCPYCGSEQIKTVMESIVFKYGLGEDQVELRVDAPVRCCRRCKERYLDGEAQLLKHSAVCRHLGVLSPADIRGIRERYGLSRASFAQLSGLGEASLSRWESGSKIQTLAYDRYLRLLQRPDVFQLLNHLVKMKDDSQDAVVRFSKFQALQANDRLLKEQANFELRLAV